MYSSQKQPTEAFYKKGVLRNFANSTGKHLCQSLFFSKVARLRPAPLLKKRFWHMCFPVNFVKFLRTPFLQNTSGRLFLSSQRFSCEFCKTTWEQLLWKTHPDDSFREELPQTYSEVKYPISFNNIGNLST